MKSKLLAISAISSAFSAILLTMSAYVTFADLFCLVISSAFVMLPLYYGSYKAGFLAFLVGGVIAFIFSGFNLTVMVIPAYLLFFGSFPLVKNFAVERGVNKVVVYVVGLFWCILAVYGIYFFYVKITGLDFGHLPKIILDNMLLFVGIAGCLFYVVYERYINAVKKFIDFYLRKIIK